MTAKYDIVYDRVNNHYSGRVVHKKMAPDPRCGVAELQQRIMSARAAKYEFNPPDYTKKSQQPGNTTPKD